MDLLAADMCLVMSASQINVLCPILAAANDFNHHFFEMFDQNLHEFFGLT